MDNIIQFPSEKRAEAGAVQATNPFLNSGLYEKMLAHKALEAIVAEELLAIQARGPGSRDFNPLTAPSLHVLRQTKKRGTTLAAALVDMAAGTNLGPANTSVRAFGLEIWDVTKNRSTGGQNARLALDLDTYCSSEPIFAKAGIANWRSLVAEDCAELILETHDDGKTFGKAIAIFYLGAGGE